MRTITISPFNVAEKFIGIHEVPGTLSNPGILSMLQLDNNWPQDDSVPWCSAFVNYIAWLLGLPRSKSLAARSWLNVGEIVSLNCAESGDVVILKRGSGNQPGPDVIDAPGHVGFYSGKDADNVVMLGGNQSDMVSISSYPKTRLLGVRRLI